MIYCPGHTQFANGRLQGPLGKVIWAEMGHSLTHLDVSRTSVTGVLPASLCECHSLRVLRLGGTKLGGFLPLEVMRNITACTELDLSGIQNAGFEFSTQRADGETREYQEPESKESIFRRLKREMPRTDVRL